MKIRYWAIGLPLVLAGCGGSGGDRAAEGNAAAAAVNEAAQANRVAAAEMPACPFQRTHGWGGAIEGGRLRINGRVDIQMAGFRPALTERPGAAAGTAAFDLAFAPAPGEPISDMVQYAGRPGAYRRGEIWCGGERIADFPVYAID